MGRAAAGPAVTLPPSGTSPRRRHRAAARGFPAMPAPNDPVGDSPLAAGNPDPTAALLARHVAELRSFVRSRMPGQLRRYEQSSDLVQSVCREALASRARFEYRSEPEFRAWLWVTALNKLRDRLRFVTAEKRDAAREVHDLADDSDHMAAHGRSPSGEAAATEQVALLQSAFAGLAPDQRLVLELSHLQGMSHAAIGERIGRTETAVRSLVFRSLARLSTLLVSASAGERGDGR